MLFIQLLSCKSGESNLFLYYAANFYTTKFFVKPKIRLNAYTVHKKSEFRIKTKTISCEHKIFQYETQNILYMMFYERLSPTPDFIVHKRNLYHLYISDYSQKPVTQKRKRQISAPAQGLSWYKYRF